MCDCLGAQLVDYLSVGELGSLPEAEKINAQQPQELVELSKVDSNLS